MKIFPRFIAEISFTDTEEHILVSLANFFETNSKSLGIKKCKEMSGRFVIRTGQSNVLFHNSFSPDIYISSFAEIDGCRLEVWFQLKNSVKTVLSFFSCVGILMETALLLTVLLENMGFSPVFFLPVIFVLFLYFLSTVFLKVLSKYWLMLIAQIGSPQKVSKLRLDRRTEDRKTKTD